MAVSFAAAAALCRFGVHQLHRSKRSIPYCSPSPAVAIAASALIRRCSTYDAVDNTIPAYCVYLADAPLLSQQTGYKISSFVNRTHASFTAIAEK